MFVLTVQAASVFSLKMCCWSLCQRLMSLVLTAETFSSSLWLLSGTKRHTLTSVWHIVAVIVAIIDFRAFMWVKTWTLRGWSWCFPLRALESCCILPLVDRSKAWWRWVRHMVHMSTKLADLPASPQMSPQCCFGFCARCSHCNRGKRRLRYNRYIWRMIVFWSLLG